MIITMVNGLLSASPTGNVTGNVSADVLFADYPAVADMLKDQRPGGSDYHC